MVRCKECNKILNLDTYKSHQGVIYCIPHHKDLFKPKAVTKDSVEEIMKKNLDFSVYNEDNIGSIHFHRESLNTSLFFAPKTEAFFLSGQLVFGDPIIKHCVDQLLIRGKFQNIRETPETAKKDGDNCQRKQTCGAGGGHQVKG